MEKEKNNGAKSDTNLSLCFSTDGASGSQVSKVQNKALSRYKGASGNTNTRNDSNRSKPSFSKGRGNVDKRGKPRGGSATSESVCSNVNI